MEGGSPSGLTASWRRGLAAAAAGASGPAGPPTRQLRHDRCIGWARARRAAAVGQRVLAPGATRRGGAHVRLVDCQRTARDPLSVSSASVEAGAVEVKGCLAADQTVVTYREVHTDGARLGGSQRQLKAAKQGRQHSSSGQITAGTALNAARPGHHAAGGADHRLQLGERLDCITKPVTWLGYLRTAFGSCPDRRRRFSCAQQCSSIPMRREGAVAAASSGRSVSR